MNEVTIPVLPESELWRALDAEDTAVRLEKNGRVYRVVEVPIDEPESAYDPEAVRAAIRKTRGSWSDMDPDEFLEELYRDREEGSRPANRP